MEPFFIPSSIEIGVHSLQVINIYDEILFSFAMIQKLSSLKENPKNKIFFRGFNNIEFSTHFTSNEGSL